MGLYRDDAVVLRVQKLGEADRIVTLLFRREGKIRAVAKGVAKVTSRIGARLEPFNHVDVQCYASPYAGRSLHNVRQVETIQPYGKYLVGNYSRYSCASAIVETAERLSGDDSESVSRLFALTVGALRSMGVGEHAPGLILDAYLLRAMALAGWAPSLEQCAVCGSPGEYSAFSVQSGGMVCPTCRPPGCASPSAAARELMVALLRGAWDTADLSEPGIRREASGLIAAHLQWHTERALRSLPLVDRN